MSAGVPSSNAKVDQGVVGSLGAMNSGSSISMSKVSSNFKSNAKPSTGISAKMSKPPLNTSAFAGGRGKKHVRAPSNLAEKYSMMSANALTIMRAE